LLRAAELWSQNHGMKYNVKKCGILAASHDIETLQQQPLLLQSEPVGIVQSYQYLGFPMTIRGLDYQRHMQTQHDAVINFLKFVQFSSIGWSPQIRWVVFRTFIRPKMEYGAPLIHAFSNVKTDKQFYNMLVDAQRECLAWVLGCKPTNYQVLEGILGVLPVAVRFAHLRILFELHRLALRPENPLAVLLNNNRSWRKDVMLTHLRLDPLYTKFVSEVPDLPVLHQKPALRQFLLRYRKAHLENTKGKLIQYIALESRTLSLVDSVLFAPSQYQKEFTTWRRGASFINLKCVCGETWRRNHVEHIPGITAQVPARLYSLYVEAQQSQLPNFTIIDFLLNQKEWELCRLLFNIMRQALKGTDPAAL
jgi:hypothetical protein